jgi:hypothetical protein
MDIVILSIELIKLKIVDLHRLELIYYLGTVRISQTLY